ncbi:MAG: O-methyltransferase [Armatimonadota bacterium]|nr:O-methyltransferase [Armatimonadota bacterium]
MQEHSAGVESALTAHKVSAGSTGEPSAPKRAELYHPQLLPYLESLVPPRPRVLQAMEAHARATNFPIVGPIVGQFFYVLTRMVGARRVFELGSGFGYSTAWFALAVRENGGGEVHHVVWDENLSQQAREFLGQLGVLEVMRFHVGEAVQTLQQVGGAYDLIFCDIDKEGYPASLPVIKRHLRVGGVVLYDNALWSGRVWDESDTSAATQGIRELTQLLTRDADFATTLLPLRDGVLMAVKLR